MLRTYKTYNSTVRFSKYEFYNKLLGDITLLRITLATSYNLNPTYIYIYIYIYSWVEIISGVILNDITPPNNLLLDMNFDKSTVRLHYIHILSMLAKFHSDQRLIVMLSINYLNSSFCNLK